MSGGVVTRKESRRGWGGVTLLTWRTLIKDWENDKGDGPMAI